MAIPSVTYTFTNSTVADATEVNTNFSDLINALTDGTSDHSISTLTLAGALTANGNVTLGNASGDTMTVNATPTFNAAVTVGAVDFTVDTDTLFVDASEDSVGIGTATPTQTLEVVGRATLGTDNTGGIDIYGDGSSRGNIVFQDSEQFRIGNNANNAAYVVEADGSLNLYDPGGVLAIGTDGSGNVGIGTSSPGAILDVQDSNTSGIIARFGDSSNSARMTINSGGQTAVGVAPISSTTFYVRASNSTRELTAVADVSGARAADFYATDSSISSSDICTIISFSGDTSPATGAALIRFQRSNASDIGGVEMNGSSNVVYQTGSDKRLKTDATPIVNALQTIRDLEPVCYKWKDDLKEDIGFLAQDVYKVYPYPVSVGDNNETEVTRPWKLDYSRFTPLLVKAIQEQQAEIDSLKARLDALESA